MTDCPFNPSDSPREIRLNLMIQQEAERGSAVLTDNGIPLPRTKTNIYLPTQ